MIVIYSTFRSEFLLIVFYRLEKIREWGTLGSTDHIFSFDYLRNKLFVNSLFSLG